jgi:hypothetical protein
MSTSSHRVARAPASTLVPSSANLNRRRFLLALGAGGAGAAVVATSSLTRPVVEAAVPTAADAGQGYRETDHVRDYYATTRI